MVAKKKERENLAFKNPNKAWVMAELEALYEEWLAWAEHAQRIEDHPYDKNRQSEIFADGEENLRKHEVLREKTLVFLDNNIQGHNFMHCNEYDEPFERGDLRLRIRVPHRIQDLEILRASLKYALVPDGFWREKGKKLVDKLAEVAPEKAVDVAASYLRNPMDQE